MSSKHCKFQQYECPMANGKCIKEPLCREVSALQAEVERLEEEKPDAAEIIELRKACAIYKTNGIENRQTITELTERIKWLEINWCNPNGEDDE